MMMTRNRRFYTYFIPFFTLWTKIYAVLMKTERTELSTYALDEVYSKYIPPPWYAQSVSETTVDLNHTVGTCFFRCCFDSHQ